jgi:hypothetical protein
MKRVSSLCPLWFVLCCWQAEAQIYDTNNDVVQTFAGSGFSGYVDGQGTQTMFNAPMAIVADTSSNLFVLDCYNYRIRKIAPDRTCQVMERTFSLAICLAQWQLIIRMHCGSWSTFTAVASLCCELAPMVM